MKNCSFFYLYSLLVSFSLMANASEHPRPELEALQKIATTAFPAPVYQFDSHVDDKERLIKAASAVQDVVLFNVPPEVFLNDVFPCMDAPLAGGLGISCRFFYHLSQISFLYLNSYCLTERMPHVIPKNILRFKTCNTKGGLLKLAALFSVSADDLCGWFDPVFLQSAFLLCQGSLPQQLEGQSEEVLGALYPVLKVALAAIQADDTDQEQKTRVLQLVQEYTSPSGEGMSLNKLRLLSLNPKRPGVYYETLQELLSGQNSYPLYSDDVSVVQIREVIARELLIKGRKIAQINKNFFVDNSQKKETAIQIIGLCLQYPNLYSYDDSSNLIDQALELECSTLALNILSQVIKLPDDANTLSVKIQSLVQYKKMKVEDENIQSYFNQFGSTLYPLRWAGLPPHVRGYALLLLMQAERREDVQNAVGGLLLQSEEEFLRNYSDSLINNLVNCNYSEEAKKLISYALNIEQDKFISTFPYILDYFFGHAINVDHEKTIALLRGYVESQVIDITAKLEALKRLAKFAIGDEKDYILSKIHSLSEEKIDDLDGDFANIFYYLGNRELCNFYYQRLFMGPQSNDSNKDSVVVQEQLHLFQKMGLNITCLEDMKTMDPFEFFDVLLKKGFL